MAEQNALRCITPVWNSKRRLWVTQGKMRQGYSRVPTEGQNGEEFFTFFFTFHKNRKILHFFLHKNGKILHFFFTKMEKFFTFFFTKMEKFFTFFFNKKII